MCHFFPFFFFSIFLLRWFFHRRFYSIMSYFFFFYNILLGLFSCIMRILKGMILGVIFISRIDRTSLMQGFQTWDKGMEARGEGWGLVVNVRNRS